MGSPEIVPQKIHGVVWRNDVMVAKTRDSGLGAGAPGSAAVELLLGEDLLQLLSFSYHNTMNSLKVARSAIRARPTFARAALQRRSYADVAPDKIQLSLTLPHQVRFLRPRACRTLPRSTALTFQCVQSIYKSQDV